MEASTTPTICRLPDLPRHQLSTIARSGADWAHFGLSIASYTFNILESAIEVVGQYVDTALNDIEWFVFNDMTTSYDSLVTQWGTPTVVESDGSIYLTKLGNRFYLYDSSDAGPVLKYGGSDVVAGPVGTWLPIGAEATASGYEVAWSLAGADQYSVWNTDSNGNFTSYITSGAVSGSSTVLQSLETSCHIPVGDMAVF